MTCYWKHTDIHTNETTKYNTLVECKAHHPRCLDPVTCPVKLVTTISNVEYEATIYGGGAALETQFGVDARTYAKKCEENEFFSELITVPFRYRLELMENYRD